MTQPDDRDEPVLPERAAEDDPARWGEEEDDDERLLGDVPPHWE